MQMSKDSTNSGMFVRSVEAAPEPMCHCILASDQQLVDIEWFCTGDSSSVLSIDPTFNLGLFYITPTTYHNLLVTTTNGNHPILLRPILIHRTKMFAHFTIHFFCSCRLSKPNLKTIAFVQYSFDRNEHSIELRPHGNSKKKETVQS